MKSILALLLMTTIGHCGIIYEVNPETGDEGIPLIGWIEIDIQPEGSTFSEVVTLSDITAYHVELQDPLRSLVFDSGVPPFEDTSIWSKPGVFMLGTGRGLGTLTATDIGLYFDDPHDDGNKFFGFQFREGETRFTSQLLWELPGTIFNQHVLKSPYREAGNPDVNLFTDITGHRFSHVFRETGRATIGINPIVTTEPRNVALLLLGAGLLFGIWRKRIS